MKANTRLRSYLNAHGIEQQELAAALRSRGASPCSVASVSRFVNGRRVPRADWIDAALDALSDLVGERVTYEEVFASSTNREAA